ncbi:hypothetical protein D9613_010373 [Agrocybe pediades]|uniref:Uncharacterized protein n=1 Tax=Agrocybe pediades TaxID=84607 RepID=A0A8H4QGI5_9AGAR|nr:hypothetical protein D9613_010373 [Agrocybe pediades]
MHKSSPKMRFSQSQPKDTMPLRYDASRTLDLLNHSTLSEDQFLGVLMTDQSTLTIHTLSLYGFPRRPRFSASLNFILHPTSLSPILASQARPESQDLIFNFFNCIAHAPQNAFRLVDHELAADDGDTSFLEKFRTLWLINRFKWGRSTEGVLHGRSSQQMRRRMFLPWLCAICSNGISG